MGSKLIVELLLRLLTLATPELRKMMCQALAEWAVVAKKTPGSADDILVWVLQQIGSCDGT